MQFIHLDTIFSMARSIFIEGKEFQPSCSQHSKKAELEEKGLSLRRNRKKEEWKNRNLVQPYAARSKTCVASLIAKFATQIWRRAISSSPCATANTSSTSVNPVFITTLSTKSKCSKRFTALVRDVKSCSIWTATSSSNSQPTSRGTIRNCTSSMLLQRILPKSCAQVRIARDWFQPIYKTF